MFYAPSRPIKIYILCKLITHSFKIAWSYANTNFPFKRKRDAEMRKKNPILQCKHVNIKKRNQVVNCKLSRFIRFFFSFFLFGYTRFSRFFDFCLHVHINYLAKSLNLNKNGKFYRSWSRKCFSFALKIIELNFFFIFFFPRLTSCVVRMNGR